MPNNFLDNMILLHACPLMTPITMLGILLWRIIVRRSRPCIVDGINDRIVVNKFAHFRGEFDDQLICCTINWNVTESLYPYDNDDMIIMMIIIIFDVVSHTSFD